jgi:hypothetical protein
MHTTEWNGVRENPITFKDEDVDIFFGHNSDYSGDIIITVIGENEEVLVVPFKALAELVGQAVLSKQISIFEQKTGIEVLGL